jgi:5-methyltetrahydrofolate--homocysteine methyltransferase
VLLGAYKNCHNFKQLNRSEKFLDILRNQVLVCDGAMGTQIQSRNLSSSDFMGLDGCNEVLSISKPDVISEIHQQYIDAGSQIIQTNTFGTLPWVLDEYERGEKTAEIAFASAQIARDVADKNNVFVVGGVGPGTKLVTLGQISFGEMQRGYYITLKALIEGGVDALLLETCQDLLQAKAGVSAALLAMSETKQLHLFVQVTIEQTGTMLLGTEISAAINYLESFPEVVGIGINCLIAQIDLLASSLTQDFP